MPGFLFFCLTEQDIFSVIIRTFPVQGFFTFESDKLNTEWIQNYLLLKITSCFYSIGP